MSGLRTQDAGFTLMEMLVALTLSSVVMLALFSMFSGVVDVASHVKFEESTAYGESVFEALLFEDLGSMYATNIEGFQFQGKSGSFLGIDGDFLSFCTSNSLNVSGTEGSFGLNRVEYLLKGGRDGKDLYRREKGHNGVPGEWEWVEALILRDVEELELEYLDNDGSYTTEWEGAGGTAPRALSLFIMHSGGKEYRFGLVLDASSYGAEE